MHDQISKKQDNTEKVLVTPKSFSHFSEGSIEAVETKKSYTIKFKRETAYASYIGSFRKGLLGGEQWRIRITHFTGRQ